MRKSIKVDTATVTHELALQFVDAAGDSYQLSAELCFDPADPYAVTAVFRTGAQVVSWTFGRELLVEGRFEPTGDGDVHVWPCLDSDGSAVVVIELESPDGELLVQADSRPVNDFVIEMLASVPLGAEQFDVDTLLDQLLG